MASAAFLIVQRLLRQLSRVGEPERLRVCARRAVAGALGVLHLLGRRNQQSLTDADGSPDVLAVHDGLPSGLSPADNEAGWRSSFAKLAALVS